MQKTQKTIDVWITADGQEHLSEFLATQHTEKLAEARALNEIQNIIEKEDLM